MTHTIRLPFADVDGTLSPLVDEAIAAGATADRGPINGTTTFDMTFADKRKANAFKAKLGTDIEVSDVSPDEPSLEERLVEVPAEPETPAAE